MSIRIMVIDMTGQNRTPGSIIIEGKIRPNRLKELALDALGIPNPLHFYYKIEIKDRSGNVMGNKEARDKDGKLISIKITSECTIFVKNPSDPCEAFGFPNPFK